jgi:phosphoglycolate phosphatase-like HAD superfamily hydrolase
MRAYLFDIDGTLSDPTHRLYHIQKQPKDWDAFFASAVNDPPIGHICTLAQTLIAESHCGPLAVQVVFVSGRSDQVRADTEAWLLRHIGAKKPLYMRKARDFRPDFIVKGELLDQIIADGFEPIMAFDDRDQVVKMWRERGIPCAQVADGDF